MNPTLRTTIPLFQVDAFADCTFSGNPAAVCPLDAWLPEGLMQAIAAENNLSETAFVVPTADAHAIRWFTPATEVDLCGHATLAAAHVLWEHLQVSEQVIRFSTRRAGPVSVSREDELLVLDFPARPAEPCTPPAGLAAALGAEPADVRASRDLLAIFETEEQVRALKPDFAALAATGCFAVIVTAPGNEVDFVSRFFAPLAGINEDPVTGSAHCTLIPYWAEKSRKATLRARQISRRGGELYCALRGDRVSIGGRAVTYLEGRILL